MDQPALPETGAGRLTDRGQRSAETNHEFPDIRMTKLLLVRHGQTDWNAQARWQGQQDVPLNRLGRAQATALAARLAGWPIHAIYSSDLRRAGETAEILAAALSLKPVYEAAWRERAAGVFEGMTGAELREKYPEAWAALQQGEIRPKNGEAPEQLQTRIVDAYQRILARHPDQTILIVSHGGALHALLSHVLELSVSQVYRLSLSGNTGLTRLDLTPRGPRLTLLNDTAHLEALKAWE